MMADIQTPYGDFAPGGRARFILWLARNTVLGYGFGANLLGRLFRSVHPWPVDMPAFGLPARLYPFGSDADAKALLNPARFSARELKFLQRIMEPESAVFVDIGANAGLFSLFAAAHASSDATIIAIEPHPVMFKRLAYNLSELLVSQTGSPYQGPEIQLLEMALGAESGTAFLQAGADDGNDPDDQHFAGQEPQGHRVKIRPLHQILWEIGIHSIDALKIDVGGGEDTVLAPFYRYAPASLWPRAVIIGHRARNHWTQDCIAECEARGYAILFKTATNTVLLQRYGQKDPSPNQQQSAP